MSSLFNDRKQDRVDIKQNQRLSVLETTQEQSGQADISQMLNDIQQLKDYITHISQGLEVRDTQGNLVTY